MFHCPSLTNILQAITRAYRKEYFGNILSKPMSFFDDSQQNSIGALVGRIAADPFQLQQLLGANMAAMLVSFINVLGCVAISLAFGWKLALAAFGTSMPVIIFATVYRIRHERKLDAMGAVVFAESAAFAAESIAAMRTVSSLTMEASVCKRYDDVLRKHVKDAFREGVFSIWLFSFSDSIALLCMAFVLW